MSDFINIHDCLYRYSEGTNQIGDLSRGRILSCHGANQVVLFVPNPDKPE